MHNPLSRLTPLSSSPSLSLHLLAPSPPQSILNPSTMKFSKLAVLLLLLPLSSALSEAAAEDLVSSGGLNTSKDRSHGGGGVQKVSED